MQIVNDEFGIGRPKRWTSSIVPELSLLFNVGPRQLTAEDSHGDRIAKDSETWHSYHSSLLTCLQSMTISESM